MRRLLYLTVLSMLVVAMMASVALAQPQRAPSGADGSYNCDDFDTQAQAQNYFEANNPQEDPDGLDADDDLEACEDSLPAGAVEPEPTTPVAPEEPAEPMEEEDVTSQEPAAVDNETPADGAVAETQYAGEAQYADDDEMAELPDTGGPALLPLAAAFALVTGGLLLKRRLS